jgi:5-methylcytosine-specific restriction endonuclease McrA
MDLRVLMDDELLARLDLLVASEKAATADIVAHLAEVDRRDVVIDKGFSSLFEYCRAKLGYSEGYAFNRIRAARASLEFPEIIPKLRSGELHLDAVVRLYPFLGGDNHRALLEKAAGASSKKIAEIVADLRPAEGPKPDVFRPLSTTASPAPPLFAQSPPADGVAEVIPPLRRLRVEFEADERLILKIDRLKSLLRHKYPFARLEEIFNDAAEALLNAIDPERAPARNCVRTQSRTVKNRPPTRRVPAAVKRAVWQRDGGRCSYVAPDGRRCEGRDALQYDHIRPYALGGPSDDAANIRLLCRPHNQRLARKKFGPRRRQGRNG